MLEIKNEKKTQRICIGILRIYDSNIKKDRSIISHNLQKNIRFDCIQTMYLASTK